MCEEAGKWKGSKGRGGRGGMDQEDDERQRVAGRNDRENNERDKS